MQGRRSSAASLFAASVLVWSLALAPYKAMPAGAPFDPALAAKAFDQLWSEYDLTYPMFILRPGVDWTALGERFRPRALEAADSGEFAAVCAEMLAHLQDLHIWVKVGDEHLPVFNRPFSINYNTRALPALIGEIRPAPAGLSWGVTGDRVGYIAIPHWSDNSIPASFDAILEEMRDTRGLIVDVRANGGGSETLARLVAGRFLDRPRVYAFSQYRNGPRHEDLTARIPRECAPRGPWRYDRPVAVLIGQRCMSSNESFIDMMAQAPNATTMGDRTRGSSANPAVIELPGGIEIGLPRWIDYRSDGQPLDIAGVQPDAPIAIEPEGIQGRRDDVLSAALDRLRRTPLPAAPIGAAGSAERDFPVALETAPANNAEEADPAAGLRIRFDRPMAPGSALLIWKKGGFESFRAMRCDESRREFFFDLALCEGRIGEIEANERDSEGAAHGFRADGGAAAAPFSWVYRASDIQGQLAASAPAAVLIVPAPDAETPTLVRVRIRFDQPMHPHGLRLVARESAKTPMERPALLGEAEYDAETFEFRFFLALPPAWSDEIQIAGLRGASGEPAARIRLKYRAGAERFPSELEQAFGKAESAAGQAAAELRAVLSGIRQKRLALNSIAETVQTIALTRAASSEPFTRLISQVAVFKAQGEDRFLGDISEIMRTPFSAGSDGETAWWFFQGRAVGVPLAEIARRDVSIADPLGLAALGVDGVLKTARIADWAEDSLEGRPVWRIEHWAFEDYGEWLYYARERLWIDRETGLPAQAIRDDPFARAISRFEAIAAGQELPAEAFRPSSWPPASDEPLGDGYDSRLLIARDGASGTMSVRWGRSGPGKTSSSGLN